MAPVGCWIRGGPSSCASGAGTGIATTSTVLPIPTNVANDGPDQFWQIAGAKNHHGSSRPSPVRSVPSEPPRSGSTRLTCPDLRPSIGAEGITRVRKMQRKIYEKAAEPGCPSRINSTDTCPWQASGSSRHKWVWVYAYIAGLVIAAGCLKRRAVTGRGCRPEFHVRLVVLRVRELLAEAARAPPLPSRRRG